MNIVKITFDSITDERYHVPDRPHLSVCLMPVNLIARRSPSGQKRRFQSAAASVWTSAVPSDRKNEFRPLQGRRVGKRKLCDTTQCFPTSSKLSPFIGGQVLSVAAQGAAVLHHSIEPLGISCYTVPISMERWFAQTTNTMLNGSLISCRARGECVCQGKWSRHATSEGQVKNGR